MFKPMILIFSKFWNSIFAHPWFQASDCAFAVFHASLALAVLQTNKELKTTISYQNPLADQFIRLNQGLEKCEKFREENNRRTAFGTVMG